MHESTWSHELLHCECVNLTKVVVAIRYYALRMLNHCVYENEIKKLKKRFT